MPGFSLYFELIFATFVILSSILRTNGDLNSDIELTLNNPTNMVVLENSQSSRRRRRTLLPPDAWACGDGGGGREEIHPPVTQSTPLRRKRCISPIQVY